MAKKTAAQRKAAAEKAAAAEAAKATGGATDVGATTQGDAPGAPQGATQATTQDDATGATQAQVTTQGDGTSQTGDQSGDQTEPKASVFDQAVTFSMGGADGEIDGDAAQALWAGSGCEQLPPMLAVAVFDCAAKQGTKICERLLDKIGITVADGEIDEASLDLIAESDEADLVRGFLAWRLPWYAFTANAASNMLEWSQHILALQAFVLIGLDIE